MARLGSAALLAVLCVIAGTSTGTAQDAIVRTEEVLSWDDGLANQYMYYSTHGVAVWFQAPEWARYVTALWVYLGSDGLPPPPPEFTMSVNRAAGDSPYVPGESVAEVHSGQDYDENSWVEFQLEQSVSIEDQAQFPERVFFVKLSWLELDGPAVGWDTDPPHHGKTFLYHDGTWAPLNGVDGMIRAAVADTVSTLVEGASWGGVKARHRGE